MSIKPPGFRLVLTVKENSIEKKKAYVSFLGRNEDRTKYAGFGETPEEAVLNFFKQMKKDKKVK